MALRWNFNERCGELVTVTKIGEEERTVEHPLYVGNAYLIALNEWDEGDRHMYSLYTFWCDEQHMKNCLGLAKGKENIYADDSDRWVKIRLSKTKCRHYRKIAAALKKAFKGLTIEVYEDKEEVT